MLTRDDVIAAAKAILLRAPGADTDIQNWIDQGFDRQTLQRAFMSSREFAIQQSRQNIKEAKARNLDARATQREVLTKFSVDPDAQYFPPQGRSTSDDISFLCKFTSSFELRTIIALGSAHEENIARLVAQAQDQRPLVVISNSPRCFDFNPPVNSMSPPVLRLPLRAAHILDLLTSLRIVPDLFVLGSGCGDACLSAYECGHERTLVVFDRTDVSPAILSSMKKVVPAHMGEIIVLDDYAVATNMCLDSSIVFGGESSEPSATDTSRLALVAIVRDEEAMIEGMLRSAANLAGLVVLADTGSTDRTCEVARAVCAEIGVRLMVVDIEFHDFSQARNAAIDSVPTSFEWILMLDADEYIIDLDKHKFSNLINQQEIDAWCLPRYNFLCREDPTKVLGYPDRQARLFRTNSHAPIRYIHAVHETLSGFSHIGGAPSNLQAFGFGSGGPHIYHIGMFKSNEKAKARAHQNDILSVSA